MMARRNKRKIIVIISLLVVCLAGLQLVRPDFTNPPVTGNLEVPPAVEQVLRSSCFNCHSNETQLKWFDRIAPASWMVASHIRQGRAALNFSHWDQLNPGAKKANLFLALNMILAGEMPLRSYTLVHPEADIDTTDIKVLKDYLVSIAPRSVADSAAIAAASEQFSQWTSEKTPSVKPAPNGITFLPDYKNWTPVSSTDRFDNGTMRIIMGNDIAVKAIKDKSINPWPDGAAFAKVAWKESMDSSGQIQPGEFWQVEFMIKDSRQYASTDGWGWARWRGSDLEPYGKDALFTTECTSCHQPMKDNDFVFTMPLHLNTVK